MDEQGVVTKQPRWLLDEFSPHWTVRSRHSTFVRASSGEVYDALEHANFDSSLVIRLLMRLRGYGRPAAQTGGTLIERMRSNGFMLLAQEPGREIVFGIVGQFWRPSGGLIDVTPDEFAGFRRDGFARAVFHFAIERIDDHTVRLSTQTHVLTFGPSATRKFRLYWAAIEFFSGLIRHEMLKSIKRDAEGIHSHAQRSQDFAE